MQAKHRKLPNVDPFDLVRIIGVTFDNAIEASKNLPNAQVNVMIYQDQPGEFEYEIDNRCRDSDLSVEKMSKAGFTTKKGHKGLGLANVDDIAKSMIKCTLTAVSKTVGLNLR